MNNEQLDKALRLLRRTGDKALVMDQASDQVFVMMDIDDYEGLLDEVGYPISPNGSLPQDVSHLFKTDDADPLQDYVLDDGLPANASTVPDAPSLTPEEMTETAPQPVTHSTLAASPQIAKKNLNFSQDWAERKPETILNEESLADLPNEDEEEKFYLEPVDEA